ncbi:hypothetical protein GGF43_003735, partial [Coemansia sp. RSA 2618]
VETESEYEFTPSDTTEIICGLKSANHDERVSALATLSTKLEQPSEELRKFVLQGECIDMLSGILNGTDGEEKLQSLWCLTNIAAGEAQMAERALAVAPYLLSLMGSDSVELQNQAIWALGNLAAEGANAREQLNANGVLDPLAAVVSTTTDAMILQTACFALSNMARKPCSYFARLFELGVPQAVAQQLQAFRTEPDCVAELAWVCTYLTASSSAEQVDQVLASGAVATLVECAVRADDMPSATLIPIIRTLGNIAAGTDEQTHALVAAPGFVALLVQGIERTSSRAVEKESLWVLSSVTAARKDDVDAMVAAGVVTDLVRIIEKQNFDIKKEAAYSLLNIAIVGQRIHDLPNRELVREFVEFIGSQDDELVRMGIQYVALLFEHLPNRQGPKLLGSVPGGIEALENQVAVTDDDDTRHLVSALIDDYYAELTL